MNLNVELKGQGFPILCLHGHPGSAQAMSVFTNPLSQDFLTLAPDLRGYGKSRTSEDFAMSDHLEDLETLLDRFGIRRCLLLGWSLGGILALELLLRSPDRFSGLILIGSAARPAGNHPPTTWQDLLYTGIAGIVNWIRPGWQWNINTFGRRSLFRYLLSQHNPIAYHYLASEALSAYFNTSGAANRALSQSLREGYNRLEDLSKIQVPSLVLAGSNDCHITARSSQETAQALPHSQWRCYENVAHLFPWEIPELVLKDIQQWIEAHPNLVIE
ncbi:alpha/beta hydrolase [Lusitaniella coriacea LEGE 07157]|uniref:Alpha/beta hydrolase n=1 Tax=Lusitaniella coriacea LEGE 07157 TaxID=945747 RepID=A0A8J7DWA1_9CYAN|nr:alpha/beta hydrolase [Lusitaniella coriacea]MBE9116349.1 alpha/beta hydrolase [Lusitaniella coriacea LEGE 07157]